MKRTRVILALSLLLNAILLGTLTYREMSFRIQRSLWESEAPNWAKYAGGMQAVADYGNGVRRFYRPTLAKDISENAAFTGQSTKVLKSGRGSTSTWERRRRLRLLTLTRTTRGCYSSSRTRRRTRRTRSRPLGRLTNHALERTGRAERSLSFKRWSSARLAVQR